VRRAQASDREAFEVLYARFRRLVHGVLLARLPPDDVPDVAQEVFIQAWKLIGTLQEPAAFGAWVATIARRRAIDHVRGRKESVPFEDRATSGRNPEAMLRAREALDAIRSLPEAYHETLVLRLVEGHSGPEIAALTGLTPDSVRVNLYRGFALLRARLGISI
jgi:RNA polymerase sigma-70 factor (ECF subfamily)